MKRKNLIPLFAFFILILALNASAAYNPIFTDSFDRSNSATVGNGWVEEEGGGGTLSILSNAMRSSATGGGYNFIKQNTNMTDIQPTYINISASFASTPTGSVVNVGFCGTYPCGTLESSNTAFQFYYTNNIIGVNSDSVGVTNTNTNLVEFKNINYTAYTFTFWVNGVQVGGTQAFANNNANIDGLRIFSDDNSAAVDWRLDSIGIYNETITTSPVYVFINNTQYNFTTGYNNTDQIAWRTNQSYPARTYDTTPTIYAVTNRSSNGTISIYNLNYTAMLANGSYYNCSEINSTTHTCTWGSVLPYSPINFYLSFQGSNSTLSTSGALSAMIVEQELITITAPVNRSFKYNENIIAFSSTTQGIGTSGLNISHFIYFSNGTLATNITQINGGVNFTSNHSLSAGNYFINASARNGSSYTVLSAVSNFTVYAITKGNITNPLNNSIVQTKNLTITWTNFTTSSQGVNITSYNATLLNSTYGINTTLFSNVGLNISKQVSLSTLRLSPGTYYIRLFGNDGQNNSVYQELNITTVSLRSSISSPADAAVISSNNFTLTYTANGTNLQACSFYWQGTLNQTQNLTEAGIYNFNKTGLTASGTYEYFLLCNDSLGNTNNSGIKTVRMDIAGSSAPGGGSGGGGSVSGTPTLTPATPPVKNETATPTEKKKYSLKVGNVELETKTVIALVIMALLFFGVGGYLLLKDKGG